MMPLELAAARRLILAVLFAFALVWWLPGEAAAQTCAMGQLYCSAGWCCPAMADGGANVCCNSNPKNQGCTMNGDCGSGTTDAGGGGNDQCAAGSVYCSAGWCCPLLPDGGANVCCNGNPMSAGCTSNGDCGTGSGGSMGSSGAGSGSGGSVDGGSSGGGACGTAQGFDVLACGDAGGSYCPTNAGCAGSGCACNAGYVAVDCSGNLCNGNCSPPNYVCAPQSGASGGGAGSGLGGGGGGKGGGGGCAMGATGAGHSAWLLLLAAGAFAAVRRRRAAVALVVLGVFGATGSACGQATDVGAADPINPGHVVAAPAATQGNPVGEPHPWLSSGQPPAAGALLPGTTPR